MTAPPNRTIEVPGGTQALARTQVVTVVHEGRVGHLPRPTLLAALVLKAAASGVDTGAELGGFALGEGGTRLGLGGVELESLPLAPAGAPYSLDFMIAEVADGLGALLRFNSDLFDGATIERLAATTGPCWRGRSPTPASSSGTCRC